jgi:hypothetical protein
MFDLFSLFLRDCTLILLSSIMNGIHKVYPEVALVVFPEVVVTRAKSKSMCVALVGISLVEDFIPH